MLHFPSSFVIGNQRVKMIIPTTFGNGLALGRAIKREEERDKGGSAANRVLKMAEQPLKGSIHVMGPAKKMPEDVVFL